MFASHFVAQTTLLGDALLPQSPGLDSSQLSNLPFKYYWKSGSNVPVPDTGWDLIQQLPLDIIVNGLQIDENLTQSTDTPVRWLHL